MINLFKVFSAPEAADAVKEVLESGFTGQGPKVESFEEILRIHFQNPYVNTLNSATSGLHLAFHIIKTLDPTRDEVLTIPATCLATNLAIIANNLKIKWVDVDPKTCNMDLIDLERKLSKNTLAICVVHWGGNPCDLNKLREIQEKCLNNYGHSPPIVEDCAHAFGSSYEGKPIGNSGNYCVFSFQSIKNLSCGDGGALISPNDTIHKIAELKRWFGLSRRSSYSFRCEQNIKEGMWGFKFHMNDIAAAIAMANYPYIKDLIKIQQENATYYNEQLKDIPGIQLLTVCGESSYWLYTLLTEKRDLFCKKLKEKGIETSQVHRRNDIQDCFKEFKSLLPNMDYIDSRHISIPCGWWVTKEEREFIIDTIKQV